MWNYTILKPLTRKTSFCINPLLVLQSKMSCRIWFESSFPTSDNDFSNIISGFITLPFPQIPNKSVLWLSSFAFLK